MRRFLILVSVPLLLAVGLPSAWACSAVGDLFLFPSTVKTTGDARSSDTTRTPVPSTATPGRPEEESIPAPTPADTGSSEETERAAQSRHSSDTETVPHISGDTASPAPSIPTEAPRPAEHPDPKESAGSAESPKPTTKTEPTEPEEASAESAVPGADAAVESHDTAAKNISPTLPPEWVKTLKWRCIGPASMGGRITALAVYEADPCHYWVATASGGLLHTTNNGITFEHQFDHENTVSIGHVAVAQSNKDIVWVGTGEANPRNSVSWGDGVYKSTDGGKTWKHMGLKESFQIGRIAIHPTNPDIVYVGALGRLWGPNKQRGLYKTTDGGETWEEILYINDQTGVIDVKMKPDDPETLIVATYERQRDGFDSNAPAKKMGPGSGLHKTTDGGKTWTRLTKGLPTIDLGRIGIDYYRKDPHTVYVVLESERIGQEPDDAPYLGIRGEDVEVGAKLTEIIEGTPAEKAELKVGDIIVSVDDATVHSYRDLVAEIRKHSAGQTATFELSRERKSVMVDVTFDPRPKSEDEEREDDEQARRRRQRGPFSAGLGGQRENVQDQQGGDGHNYGGVYKSTDGGESWVRINSVNPRPMYFSQIRVDPSDDNHLYILGISLYRSKDGGKTFTGDGGRGAHPDHHAMWIDPEDGRHIILGNDGGLYVTHDRMEKWDHLNHMAIGQFYDVGVGPRRNYRVYGGLQDNGSWGGPSRARSGDGPVNQDWFRVGGGDGFICRVDPHDADRIYYESQNGSIGRLNLRTGERGISRPRPPRGTKYRFNWKTPFILSSHNSKIYYTAGNHVLRSLDRGDKLKLISPEITRTDRGSATALAESPVDADVLYVGTDDGALWVTKNGGHDWSSIVDFPAEETQPAERPETIAVAAEERAGDDEAEALPGSGTDAATNTDTDAVGKTGETAERRSRRRRDADADAEGPQRSRRGGGMIERIMQRDANGDGKIQKDETPQRMRPMFDRLDANSDGAIDREELETMAKRMRAFRRPPGAGGRPPKAGASDSQRIDSPGAAAPDRGTDRVSTSSSSSPQPRYALASAPAAPLPPEKNPPPTGEEPATSDEPAPETNKNRPSGDTSDPATEPEPTGQAGTVAMARPVAMARAAAAAVAKAVVDAVARINASPVESLPAEPLTADTPPPPPADDPLTGDWEAVAIIEGMPSGQGGFTLSFNLGPEGKVSGTMSSRMGDGPFYGGRYNAETKRLSFTYEGEMAAMEFTATVGDSTMTGHVDIGNGMFTFDFDAKRVSRVVGAAATDEADEAEADKYDWKPLGELIPGPRWVSSIEASRVKAGRAYLTLDGHRSDDDEPYVLVTENHGETWRSLRANLPAAAGSTRVIREDIENPNILYLGTEFGAWVTIDRGASWTRLNGSLPTVAVHEFAIHPTAGEIVAATHGRSLWVLDVTPLRQMADDTVKKNATLYKPATAIFWRPQPSRGGGTRRYVGQNPDPGAQIYYSLNGRVGYVELRITDPAGKTIRELEAQYGAGLHRAEWNLRKARRSRRRAGAAGGRGGRGRGGRGRFNRGRLVESGKYLVELTVDDDVYTRELRVETDPEFPDYHPWEIEQRELERLKSWESHEPDSVDEPNRGG